MMLKYVSLKGHGSKLIHKKLVNALQDNTFSLFNAKNWLRRFKSDDLSLDDENGSEDL
jgi:hypothetical protein